MHKVKIFKVNTIKEEGTHDNAGLRRKLLDGMTLNNLNLDIFAIDYLEPGKYFDWHEHIDMDEFALVLEGEGEVLYGDSGEKEVYKSGDVIVIPPNTYHRIEAYGGSLNRMIFLRIKHPPK
jgi:quercetin dioxygenase-like cupin family protein